MSSGCFTIIFILCPQFHKPFYYAIKLSVGTTKSIDMWNYLLFMWQRREYVWDSILHAVLLHCNHNGLDTLITKAICDVARLALE